ncbi:hypothetical protein PMAYCL1PPCAC_22431, partial [Pristionchus mayeri]
QGVKCTLCAKYTHNYAATPSNPGLRDDLLRRVLPRTKEAMDILTRLLSDTKSRAFFCAEHIQEQPVNVSSRVEESLRPRECYLCGETSSFWLATPKNPTTLPVFFEHLVEMDSEQLKKIHQLIQWNTCASICTKHYNGPTV